jgi:hypothetical protein
VSSMKRFSLMAALICLLLGGCASVSFSTTSSSTPPPEGSAAGAVPQWGVQTRTSGCVVHGALQDSGCTPGALVSAVSRDQICRPGYASSVRNVTTSTKDKVYAEYGITHRTTGEYEVDHLVSLELGGSNDISNLWPEAASPKPGFHEKDKVENYLHSQVCAGAISLDRARVEIATNWLAVYTAMPTSER